MDEITLKDYRCFHERQTARLAPLTLLVGENSTGKTSFMALVRALWDVAYGFRIPDFKEDPYDLGSFDEIAHHRGGGVGQPDFFKVGFQASSWPELPAGGATPCSEPYRVEVTLARRGTAPVPIETRHTQGDIWIEQVFEDDQSYVIRLGNSNGEWENRIRVGSDHRAGLDEWVFPRPFHRYFPEAFLQLKVQEGDHNFTPLYDSRPLDRKSWKRLVELATDIVVSSTEQRPISGAPVRSKPRRTYDPARTTPDPEGGHLPMYLASMYFRDKLQWAALRKGLEAFGKASGLFEEVTIRPLGKRDSDPFQVQVRKSGGRRKGPWRNLIDVGYGVSQALPVITELLRPDAPSMFLLQQPEVHLHPSAQAALGSLFCQVASWKRQLIIETHSDHLIDRVRMDVRDGESALKPDDVSILYFERDGLDVRIHSLHIDEDGNMDVPDSYRRFFMEETTRSLGL